MLRPSLLAAQSTASRSPETLCEARNRRSSVHQIYRRRNVYVPIAAKITITTSRSPTAPHTLYNPSKETSSWNKQCAGALDTKHRPESSTQKARIKQSIVISRSQPLVRAKINLTISTNHSSAHLMSVGTQYELSRVQHILLESKHDFFHARKCFLFDSVITNVSHGQNTSVTRKSQAFR